LVVDWGLGKTLGQLEPASHASERKLVLSSASGSAETLPGSALGTPAYMSPEQSCGDLDRLGPRSDVYSLGATLYCLLTGRPPFEGADVGKVLLDVQRGDFPPPRQLDPSINKALEAVCKKAMATKPDDRYGSCRALAADIERWTADMPVTSWNEPFTRRARRWMNRNRTAVTAAFAAVMVALAGLGAVVAVQAQANGALTALNAQLYESNVRVSRANAELSTANEKITQANSELVAKREKVQARFDLARDAIRLFHGEVSEDLLLKEKQFEDLRHKLLRGAADSYGKLEALLQGQSDRVSRAALGRAYDELGDLTARIGDQPEALGVHKKALAVRRSLAASPEADARTALDVAMSLTAVGLPSRQTGDTTGALAAFDEARGLADGLVSQRVGNDAAREVLGTCHYQIARLISITGKPSEALKALDQALAIRQAVADANPAVTRFQSDLANSHNLVGFVLAYIGKQSEALEAYGRSLPILRTLVDTNPAVTQFQSNLARSHSGMALLLYQVNKRFEALKSFNEARVIQQRLVDANPSVTDFQNDLARCLSNIGDLLANEGRIPVTLATLEKGTVDLSEARG
jgi:eukaryotic-like serine/threonine-protein kinase